MCSSDLIFNTIGATKDDGEPDHCGEKGGASEWYAFLADSDGVVVADTVGSDYDTVLAAYFDNGTGTGLFDGMLSVGCNNDYPGLGRQSQVSFNCVAGRIYYLAVDGVGGAAGIAQVNYRLIPPLSVTTPPANVTTNVGKSATFHVAAAGASTLRYQWRKSDVAIPGKTTQQLALSNVQPTDAGPYSVVVSNAGGSVTSAPVSLTVNLLPTIATPPVAATVNQGGTANFTVTPGGTAPFSFQWQKGGSDLPGKTAQTLTLANVQSGDIGAYAVIVRNVAGAVTSAPVNLSVILVPPGAAPGLAPSRLGSGQIRFSVTGTTGSTYVLERSVNLSTWVPVQTNTSGDRKSTRLNSSHT